ncbi:MAG: thioredoxin-dependent thiol peroxidase [Alistipes sp.]|nr:thioredoxin-dependent thiol peroxidase [Alistipes sp.]
MLNIGDKIPEVFGMNEAGAEVTRAQFSGQKLVIYFYPKDNTSGCTLEAKSLRDGKAELLARGYKIVGVSPDSVKSHQNFCNKHELNFTLLADTDHSLSEAVGVWQQKKMCGREYMGIVRTTLLLDSEARVTHIIEKVDTKDSYGQIVKLLDKK